MADGQMQECQIKSMKCEKKLRLIRTVRSAAEQK